MYYIVNLLPDQGVNKAQFFIVVHIFYNKENMVFTDGKGLKGLRFKKEHF